MHLKTKQFNIMLTPIQYLMLEELADACAGTKSYAFRLILTAAHNHTIRRIKSCPDGRPCLVPSLHPVPLEPVPAPSPFDPPLNKETPHV